MNAEQDASTEDLTALEARRRRVFRRSVLGVGVAIAALVGLWTCWGVVAGRRIQAEIDRCHAAGEPILVEDFIPAVDVPDERNAALLYQQAAAALVRRKGTAFSFSDLLYETRVPAAYPEDTHAIVEANTEALALLRQARDLPEADWGVRPRSPLVNMMLPMLYPHRELAYFARTAAILRHLEGDHADAIETVRDIHALADTLGQRGDACIITHLVAIANHAAAVRGLEIITPTLVTLDAAATNAAPAHPVPREQVEQLIRTLLDEERYRSSWRKGMHMERAMELDSLELIMEGKTSLASLVGYAPGGLWDGAADRVARPIIQLDTVRMMRFSTKVCEAGLARNFPQARAMRPFSEDLTTANQVQRLSRFMSSSLFPSFDRAMTLHFRALAKRRMAATALAIRLYELDHGHRLDSLAALVPAYLPALPEDPFAADGRAIGYRPEASPPILYSVGDDGVDDGGTFVVIPEWGGIDREQKDQPYFLDGDRPRPPMELDSGE